jgi:quercetin dioxygenase-like cupin family protein
METRFKVRRVITGHDREGKSVVVLDEELTAAPVIEGRQLSRAIVDVWATVACTAERSAREEAGNPQAVGHLKLNASEIRVVVMQPGSRREMHRTDTIDYGIVLSGEIHLILEQGETLLRSGDVVIQRGTNHSWDNRSASVARLAFINMSGQTTDHERCPKV